MSIIKHRTFTYALLRFIDGDISQMPKLRAFGAWSEPELAHIAYIIANERWNETEGKGPDDPYRDEIADHRRRWDEYHSRLEKQKGESVDFNYGEYPEWDAIFDQIGEVMDRQYAAIFVQMGEAELAHLMIDHSEAYEAMERLGAMSLRDDKSVIPVWASDSKDHSILVEGSR